MSESTGETLRRIRQEKGLSQITLAERIGGSCTQPRISLWESGLEPSWLYHRLIVEALEVDADEFGW
jgi:transcriptional regulator with XRE-family HTH domain